MWYELAENPLAIINVYHSPPILEGLALSELTLHYNGPRLTIKAELNPFPDNPPIRWVRERYNKVQVQLDFWEISSINVSSWSTEMIINLQINRRADNLLVIEAKTDKGEICFQGICQSFRIAHLAPYNTE
jgi:hypothetical protein